MTASLFFRPEGLRARTNEDQRSLNAQSPVSISDMDSLAERVFNGPDSIRVREGFEIAAYYREQHQYARAVDYYERVLTSCELLKDSSNSARASYYLGMCYRNLGVLNRSLEHLFAALSISELIKDDDRTSSIYIQIGLVKKEQNLFEEAIEYFEKALDQARQPGMESMQASLYNNIGSAYKNMGQYAEAKEYFLKAIDINKRTNNVRFLSYNYNNVANIYEETNDLPNALIYHEKSVDLKKQINDLPSLSISYCNISLVYMKMGRYELAKQYAEESLQLAEKYKVAEILPTIYAQYALILSQQNDFKGAYDMMQRLNDYRDSLSQYDRQTIISDMEAKYKRQTVEAENALLKKDLELQEAELSKKDTFLIAFAVCIAMLTLVLVLYYLSYRSRTEANESLLIKNKAILAQKERIENQKRRIEESTKNLEKIRKDKEVFFSTISHDMRGPLGAISAIINIMKSENDPSEELLVLDYSAKALSALVEDIMDFSNLESDRLYIDSRPIDLAAIVEEVGKTFTFISNEKEIDLLVEIARYDQPVLGDPKRIRQVLFNLLGNAFKFTQEGFVKLRMYHSNEDDASITFGFEIQDTGIGIAADKLDIIFNKYAQASEETYRDFGGSGLGLYITKVLIERMGGHINVQSVIGEGTIFVFQVPFRKIKPISA